jgi:hypothetical protein
MAAAAREATSEVSASATETTSEMSPAAATTTTMATAASTASAARQGIGREGGRAKRDGCGQDDCFMERDYLHGDSPVGC